MHLLPTRTLLLLSIGVRKKGQGQPKGMMIVRDDRGSSVISVHTSAQSYTTVVALRLPITPV